MRHGMRSAIGAGLLTALTAQAAPVFINEIHYDNSGSDQGEGIELAGPAGTDLTGWRLTLYNGHGGTAYHDITLSGIIPDQQSGFGTLAFATALQNGPADGIALLDPGALSIQFISYEGTLAAADGPAAGLISRDIGVAEHAATPLAFSLQLTGHGRAYQDFHWTSGPASFGAINTGQSFPPAATLAASPSVPAPAALSLLGLGLPGLRRRLVALERPIRVEPRKPDWPSRPAGQPRAT